MTSAFKYIASFAKLIMTFLRLLLTQQMLSRCECSFRCAKEKHSNL